jgi:hypothetical protein
MTAVLCNSYLNQFHQQHILLHVLLSDIIDMPTTTTLPPPCLLNSVRWRRWFHGKKVRCVLLCSVVISHLCSFWSLLQNNTISGPIPTQIGMMTKLQFLYLPFNRFISTVETPITFWNFDSKQHSYLYFNNLSGTIPTQIGTTTQLFTL